MVNFSFDSVNSGQTRLTHLTRLTPLTRLTQSTQRVNSVNPGDSVNSVRRFDDSTRRFGKELKTCSIFTLYLVLMLTCETSSKRLTISSYLKLFIKVYINIDYIV
ncbi:hypothetical protein HanIR_Chr12g0562131 [Helianthus annuus]|nr:hypothetical protein HanIR_Chr12g0562131 [Helianthus annuus]